METKIETKPIKLPNKCWKTLQDCLFSTAWANRSKDIVLIGKMEEDNVINIDSYPEKATVAIQNEWADEEKEIALSLRQVECCKKALKEAIAKQIFYATKYTGKLLATFLGED